MVNVMNVESVKHGFYLVVECLVIEVINFDSLEIFLWIEVALGDQEGLSEDQFLYKKG